MPTPAYTAPSRANPQQSQNGLLAIASALANDNAYQDGIILGTVAGWTLATTNGTGTAEKPQIKTFSNGVERLRLTYTWTGDYVTSILREWSNDSGATYVTIATEGFTRDGSSNSTTGTNTGILSWFYELFGKFLGLRTSFNAHTAATGTAVHGLGTIATQAASAVAITGGSVVCTYERENVQVLANGNAANTCSWVAGGYARLTVTGASASIAMSNLPPNGTAQVMTFIITNGGLATTLFSGLKWPGGVAQTFSASGRDILAVLVQDGATLDVVGFGKGQA